MSKLLITDKYYQRSRESYSDRTSKQTERIDVDKISPSHQRNVTFYYDGIIDHYILDYPSIAEVFGLLGGVIALFFFTAFCTVHSYN